MYKPGSPNIRPLIMGTGMWAWLLQRITGVALVLYLLVHIVVISSARGGEKNFDNLLGLLQTPLFVVLDLALLAAILYHGLNGIRVVLFDLGIGVRSQRNIFAVVVVVAAICWVVALYFTWPFIFKS